MNDLGVSTPGAHVLFLPGEVRQRDAPQFTLGEKKVEVTGELHFGSEFPVNPDKVAIFDYIGAGLHQMIVNKSDFVTSWILDIWLNQTDARQAVFVRDKRVLPFGMRAFMIDNGMCFDGPRWEIRDHLCLRQDPHRGVLKLLDMADECQRSLGNIDRLSPNVLTTALQGIPSSWLMQGDEESLTFLIESVWKRHRTLHAVVERHLALLASSSHVPLPSSQYPILLPDRPRAC